MHKVEDLKVWVKSIELVKEVYKIITLLPKEEKFGLIDQIRRSSVSIPSNIAEGAGRNNVKEFNHFLGIANGSAYELNTQLILTYELSMIPKEKVIFTIEKLSEIQKMLYGLQKSLLSQNS